MLTGCVAPNVRIKTEGDIQGYKKVYLIMAGEDPAGVYPGIVARLRQTGFDVTPVDPKGPPVGAQGSGFIISPEGDVLTCAHIVRGVTSATIWIEGTRYPCAVLNCDTNLDLALLKITGDHPPFHPLRLRRGNDYSLGENVYTMGFPMVSVLGTSPRLDNGLINAKVGLDDNTNFLQVSVPIQPGNSGGPLMDANSEVIGVISSTLNPVRTLVQTGGALPQNVNFAIKLSSVQKLLAASKITLSTNADVVRNFDQAEKSIAIVRNGNVTDKELKERTLVCVCGYRGYTDFRGYHFSAFVIAFVDNKTDKTVLTAVETSGDYTVERQLDGLFSNISSQFFPDRPDPFNK